MLQNPFVTYYSHEMDNRKKEEAKIARTVLKADRIVRKQAVAQTANKWINCHYISSVYLDIGHL